MSHCRPSLFDLPLEIFRIILAQVVHLRGLKRALRLRLVNRVFQEELVEALCVSNLINEIHVHLDKLPWVRSYVERRLCERRTKALPILNTIGAISERLAAEKRPGSNYESYATQLLRLSSSKKSIRELLTTHALPIESSEKYFDFNILSAAVYTNHTSVVMALANEQLEIDDTGGLFGNPFEVAAKKRNPKILSLLLAGMFYDASMMSKAVQYGNLELVKHLLGPECKRLDTWLKAACFARMGTREGQAARARFQMFLLATPCVDTFGFLVSLLQSRQLAILDDGLLRMLLRYAVQHDWPVMVKHLIMRGAPLTRSIPRWESCLHRVYKDGRAEIVQLLLENGVRPYGTELTTAATHGHAAVIKILLKNEATLPDLCTEHCLYAAARRGFMDIVRLLLDFGIDPNKGESPLVGAIEAEHTAMFRMLIQRGAVVSRILPEAISQAEKAGLESMLAVLNEYAGQD